MSNKISLDRDQINFAIRCFAQWVRVREDLNMSVTSADVDHSVLLHRLLSGFPLLEKAPPKRFSYPCYELGDGKEVLIFDISELENYKIFDRKRELLYEGCVVCIDQEASYVWEDRDKNILRHVPSGDLYQLTNKDEESEGIDATGQKYKVRTIGKYLQKLKQGESHES